MTTRLTEDDYQMYLEELLREEMVEYLAEGDKDDYKPPAWLDDVFAKLALDQDYETKIYNRAQWGKEHDDE